jgi:hypothetical protein
VTRREQASDTSADLLVVDTLDERAATVSTVLVSQTDPRGPKAVAIATDSGQWLKVRMKDGRKAYGIRSSVNPDEVYFVTRTSCTCYDGQRRTCKHQIAVQLHCELMAEQEGRASVGPDNIVQAAQAAAKSDDIFARFEQDDRPLPTPDLSRILGKPRRGVIPASQIVRED